MKSRRGSFVFIEIMLNQYFRLGRCSVVLFFLGEDTISALCKDGAVGGWGEKEGLLLRVA